MKLAEFMNVVNKYSSTHQTEAEELFEELDIPEHMLDLYNDTLDRPPFWYRDVATWMCTDTIVGLRVIFIEQAGQDLPVAITFKPGRKSDTYVYWLPTGKHLTIEWAMQRMEIVIRQRAYANNPELTLRSKVGPFDIPKDLITDIFKEVKE